MSSSRIRRRCTHLVDGLDLPDPFDLDAFCQDVARRRGRPIRRLARELPGDRLTGLWVATDGTDYVLHERRTSRVHQEHIVLHELGHLLCEHGSVPADGQEASLLLLPDLDPSVVRRMLRRTAYSEVEEQEAELVASLILERVSRWSSRRSWDVSPDAEALVRRLEHALSPAGT